MVYPFVNLADAANYVPIVTNCYISVIFCNILIYILLWDFWDPARITDGRSKLRPEEEEEEEEKRRVTSE